MDAEWADMGVLRRYFERRKVLRLIVALEQATARPDR
jgi:hypothetical protein